MQSYDLHSSSLNSDEGGWQIFEDTVLKGGAVHSAPKQLPSTRAWSSPPNSPRENQSKKALERMKENRLDAIFKLLDDDKDGLVQLPLHNTEIADVVRRVQDVEVATLIVHAMSAYSSTQPATKYGEEITFGDFKRACFAYFSNTGIHISRKTFPWKTILAYDKASAYSLPLAANRALQAFQNQVVQDRPPEQSSAAVSLTPALTRRK